MPVTNHMLNDAREAGCFAVTPERKYYEIDSCFIKRSLRPDEWQVGTFKGNMHVPRLGRERILNEGAAMQYVAAHTDVPVPKLHCCFEDTGAVYLVMEYVEGVSMSKLSQNDQATVRQELLHHQETLHGLRRRTPGGPSGLVIPPCRAMEKHPRERWTLRDAEEDLVFCHNDLSMPNVIVDPATLKIKAIIDWEYAGFWPEWFDMPIHRRLGPSSALEGETDDSDALIEFLQSHQIPGK